MPPAVSALVCDTAQAKCLFRVSADREPLAAETAVNKRLRILLSIEAAACIENVRVHM